MKKGFLYTSLLVIFLGVFMLGGVEKTFAQIEDYSPIADPSIPKNLRPGMDIGQPYTYTDPKNHTVPQDAQKITYGDGTYVIVHRDINTTGEWTGDFYNADNKKIDYSYFKDANTAANWYGDYSNYSKETTQTKAEKAAAGEGKDDNFVTNALQIVVLQAMIWEAKLIAWIVSFTGDLFDKVIEYTTTPEALSVIGGGVTDSWKIIRDFSNIILVFSLLYLGIKTILEGNGFADKKVLIGIIIAAVTINFSLFFVRDIAFNISNTIGQQILTQANLTGDDSKSFSEGLMGMVSPQRILNNAGFNDDTSITNIAKSDKTGWGFVFKTMGQIILFTVVVIFMAFVFIGVSIMLLYRFFIFVVLMIFSPIGLISTQIPWLQKIGADWRDHLKKQTLFFPAFALIFYIILLIVTTLALSNPTQVSSTLGDSLFRFLFNFILIIGFMFSLLILPGKLGLAGASFMSKTGKYLEKKARNLQRNTGAFARGTGAFAGRMALSGTARTGRLALGRGVGGGLTGKNATADKLRQAAQGEGIKASLARQTLRAAAGLKNSTFDVRNTDFGAGMGMGKGISNWEDAITNRKQKLEEKKKKEEKLLGYDKMKADPAEIANATAERDNEGAKLTHTRETLKNAQTTLNAAIANKTATQAQKDAVAKAQEEHDKQIKTLEEKEIALGKIKNKGDSEYIKLLQRRQKRWTIGGKLNTVERLAIEKLEKELADKWKSEGKYKEPKKKKNTSSGGMSPAISSGIDDFSAFAASPSPILGPDGRPARS